MWGYVLGAQKITVVRFTHSLIFGMNPVRNCGRIIKYMIHRKRSVFFNELMIRITLFASASYF